MKLLDDDGLAEKGIPHGRVQRWRLIKVGKFPKPVKVGSRNAWLESEIDQWIADRIVERDTVAA